ncbi:MAG: hypothetical protein GY845_06710 [Planctomycetes bacterium]|nr:hypothetical protein [Planctomycetota bacterium]
MNEETILIKLRSQKTFTVDHLISLLRCSSRTAHRRMKAWNVHTSINQNGRYYALPDIPKFDSNGLWKYRNILFSKHGTLKQTIIQVIQQSHHGLSSHEITDQIGLPPNQSLLSHLRESSDLRREKHHGRYIYFAGDSKIYAEQKRQWNVLEEEARAQLSDEEAVLVLAYYIKHSDLSPEDLASRISRKGQRIKAVGIRQLLESHDLLKKTSDTTQ